MFYTYLTLGRACQQGVPDLVYIDLDKGQLDDPDAFNSLTLPALLIGQTDLDWSQLANRSRLGVGIVTTKTVVRLPAHTFLSHPAAAAHLLTLDVAERVEAVLLEQPGVTTCTNTKEYASGPYYVVEQTYAVSYKTGPTYRQQEVALTVNPFFHRPTPTPTA